MIRILLADDHPLIREGLRKILEMEPDFAIIAEAADAREAFEVAREKQPDVVVLDINMPKGGGLWATRYIREACPQARVIILTIHDDQEYVGELLRAGAQGYLLKDVEPARIVEAIRQVVTGELYLPPDLMEAAVSQLRGLDRPLVEQLTAREREILALIAAGRTNREIGQTLFIAEKTVKNHVTRLLRKLNLQDRTQAAVYAVKHAHIVDRG